MEKAKADGLSKMLEKMHRKNLELFQEFKEISATLQEFVLFCVIFLGGL